MSTKSIILEFVNNIGALTTNDVVLKLGISRQAAVRYLSALVAEGKIAKMGSTRSARYVSIPGTAGEVAAVVSNFKATLRAESLEEDIVFNEVDARLGLKRGLSPKAYQIANFAFTEMLNNAIDHSRSEQIQVEASLQASHFSFEIRDRGIGVFENIRSKFNLRSHYEAIEHLLKGKQTTAAEKHSGQGIFFTSKAADRFHIRSAKTELVVDNTINDYLIQTTREWSGSIVGFALKRRSRRDLKGIFDAYSNEDYEFDKTLIKVVLSSQGSGHISRSQAKRILFGLDKFKRIVLDFSKVNGVGQGFVDEIFRIFKRRYPDISLEPINMNEAVRFMVERGREEG